MDKLTLGWKTLSGVLLTVFGFVSQPEVLAVLPERIAAIVMAIGMLLAGFGIRVAFARVEAKADTAIAAARFQRPGDGPHTQ